MRENPGPAGHPGDPRLPEQDGRRDDISDKQRFPQPFNPHQYATPGPVNDGQELWHKLVRHHPLRDGAERPRPGRRHRLPGQHHRHRHAVPPDAVELPDEPPGRRRATCACSSSCPTGHGAGAQLLAAVRSLPVGRRPVVQLHAGSARGQRRRPRRRGAARDDRCRGSWDTKPGFDAVGADASCRAAPRTRVPARGRAVGVAGGHPQDRRRAAPAGARLCPGPLRHLPHQVPGDDEPGAARARPPAGRGLRFRAVQRVFRA